jgi:hypothetical protein
MPILEAQGVIEGYKLKSPIAGRERAEEENTQWNASTLTLQGHLKRASMGVVTGSPSLTISRDG